MIRLYALVEGQTEREFCSTVLAPHLRDLGTEMVPIIVETGRDARGAKRKGGGDWGKWERDLRRLVGEHRGPNEWVTTLFDLYGLPSNFPSLAELRRIADTRERADKVEQTIQQHVGGHWRFIPYVQRHEFEALVLAALDSLEALLDPSQLAGMDELKGLLSIQGPEDINDGDQSAPSKRLEASIKGYHKVLHGPMAIAVAGLSSIRAVCPRFNGWLRALEGLAGADAPTVGDVSGE